MNFDIFSCEQLKNFVIFLPMDWQISQVFTCDWFMNFAIFSCYRLVNFVFFFWNWLMNFRILIYLFLNFQLTGKTWGFFSLDQMKNFTIFVATNRQILLWFFLPSQPNDEIKIFPPCDCLYHKNQNSGT